VQVYKELVLQKSRVMKIKPQM